MKTTITKKRDKQIYKEENLFLLNDYKPVGETVVVSVICLCFNHAKYLRRCFEGFLKQKVNFNVEILVHDDASTDDSQKIIREYERKYGNIFIGLFESYNQYCKGINIETDIMSKHIKGKYVAFCEGDDYWDDPYKLFKQVKALENNSNINFVVHKVKCVDLDGKLLRNIPNDINKTAVLDRKEIVPKIIESYMFHTTSYFFKAIDYLHYCKNKPAFAKKMTVGDYPLQLYFSNLGKTLYINECMSTHVDNVPDSWTRKMRTDNNELQEQHSINMIESLELFDEYTNHEFHESFNKRLDSTTMHNLYKNKKYREILSNKKYSKLLKKYDYHSYITINLMVKHPKIYSALKRNKGTYDHE